MVSDQARGRTSISILRQTKDALDSIKHPGQSYNGLIQELINLWQRLGDLEARLDLEERVKGDRRP